MDAHLAESKSTTSLDMVPTQTAQGDSVLSALSGRLFTRVA